MASPSRDADIPIKHEPSISNPETATNLVAMSPLKRRHFDESEDSGEKRQRIESATAGLDFSSIINQAMESAEREFIQPTIEPVHSQSSVPPQFPAHGYQNSNRSQNLRLVSDPHLQMRIMSLPVLESLSIQVLSTLAQGPYDETISIVTKADSGLGQTYTTLKSLFDQTKKIYSQDHTFLCANELHISEPEQRETIRIANLATFLVGVFSGNVGFYDLADNFIESFFPEGAPVEKEPGDIFIELKTQMYLGSVTQEEQEKSKEDLLEELFSATLEDLLSDRHEDGQLSGDEVDFVSAYLERRNYLDSVQDISSLQALTQENKWEWEDFLKRLSKYMSKLYEPLIAPYMKRHGLTAPPPRHESPASRDDYSISDIDGAKARMVVDKVLESLGVNTDSSKHSVTPQQPQVPVPVPNNFMQTQASFANTSVPPNQSAPTQALYERARQIAASKQNPGSSRGRPGMPSQRRPWGPDEEAALMAGLDAVKGPHWSQILGLYGPNGTIGQVLKDRNQVQLKDKARNLKLFFLKSGIEVPFYLQSVTGELKTRAPSQAARREAEEAARLASEGEQARMESINILAGGFQHPHGGRTPTLSPYSQDSPEEFHVLEPEARGSASPIPTNPQYNSDERLRQTLIAANNATPDSHTHPASIMTPLTRSF